MPIEIILCCVYFKHRFDLMKKKVMDQRINIIIEKALQESLKVKEEFVRKNTTHLIDLAECIARAFNNGRKLMLCGNGGSAADAQHIAAEFINRLFQLERPPLPALALTTDTSIITSVANDYGYEEVYSKQIKALGVEGDILLAISTSGRSGNILSAVTTAKQRGLYTVGFLGGDGGELLSLVDLALVVESNQTPRIQETHILAGHLVCELVEHILFKGEYTR
jgi:D-sedoheptulose 7-phosphate isomerase